MAEVDLSEIRPAAASGCVGADPGEAAAVRHGWQLLEVHERLGQQGAANLFRPELAAWLEYAKGTVADLVPWLGAMDHAVYRNDNNRVRYRKTLDLIMPGETVFDVGFGRGYLCGLLLRDCGIAGYHGIDIDAAHLDMVAAMFKPNGLNSDEVHVCVGDVYELDPSVVAHSGASVVVCCEVLEHVSDPEKALLALADVLPDDTDLIFSVPLYGRLEQVWGHSTVFDTTRLKSMCERAGLFVHSVEPVANVWAFVVASRSATPSERVAAAAATVPAPRVEAHGTYDFREVAPSQITRGQWIQRVDFVYEPTPQGAVRCQVSGRDPDEVGPQGQYGGIAFPVVDLRAVRIRVGVPKPHSLEAMYVDAYAGSTRTARWRSKPKLLHSGGARRWAFRPGQDNSGFTYNGRPQTIVTADRVEVFVRVSPGSSTSFTVEAAYLPGPGAV